MKLRMRTALAAVGIGTLGIWAAHAAGLWSTLPIIGGSSYCASTVTGTGGLGGITGQGQGTTGSICGQTVPAGPPFLTGAELIPMDTGLGGSGSVPATATYPAIALSNRVNWLIGSDFGQNLWQRGTTPVNALVISGATMTADGWYAYDAGPETITVTKQTGTADLASGSTGSLRIARPSAQTGTGLICSGQLVPDDSSQTFLGRTAIFSVDMEAGANFSAANSNVQMVIAYHTASDATASANGQGTNTTSFASSVGTTQNITNYTESVTLTPITTTMTRYSSAFAIPAATAAGTAVTGVGVKLCFTPVGTAGTNDWFEFSKAQLESRAGTSVSPSPYVPNTLSAEWGLEYARYLLISEGSTGTPTYGTASVGPANVETTVIPFPVAMRIAPSSTPLTVGSFELLIAGVPTSPSTLTAVTNTTFNGSLGSTATAVQGQTAILTRGSLGTGRIGFSAEP